jgi:hypothetical protein
VIKREHYQQMAAECVRCAHQASNPDNKALLLQMAQTWVHFAEQATGELPASATVVDVAGSE